MWYSLGLAVAQFAAAFLTVDLFFRYMDLTPAGFAARVRGYGCWYAAIAALCSAVTAVCQWHLGGWAGAAFALLNPVPWWLLWRFGLRKQLTFLFKDDGGRPVTRENPDL